LEREALPGGTQGVDVEFERRKETVDDLGEQVEDTRSVLSDIIDALLVSTDKLLASPKPPPLPPPELPPCGHMSGPTLSLSSRSSESCVGSTPPWLGEGG